MIRHPSKRALSSWLGGEPLPKVESHLATCERCATHLETVSEPRSDGAIAATLVKVLAPPSDFTNTIEHRVVSKLDSRQVLGYLADMYSAGFETSRLFITDDPADDQ